MVSLLPVHALMRASSHRTRGRAAKRSFVARTFGRGSFRGVPPDPGDYGLVLLDGRLDDGGVLARLLRLQRPHALVKHVRVHRAVVAAQPALARSVQRHDAARAPGRAAPRGNERRAQGRGGGRAARRVRAELAPEGRAESRVRSHGARRELRASDAREHLAGGLCFRAHSGLTWLDTSEILPSVRENKERPARFFAFRTTSLLFTTNAFRSSTPPLTRTRSRRTRLSSPRCPPRRRALPRDTPRAKTRAPSNSPFSRARG